MAKKNILKLLIPIIIAIAVFLILTQYQKETEQIVESQGCLEEISQMNEESLVEKIEELSVTDKEYFKIVQALRNYFECIVHQNYTEEKIDEIKNLLDKLKIEKLIINDEKKLKHPSTSRADIEDIYQGLDTNIYEPIYKLIAGEEAAICSDGQLHPLILDGVIGFIKNRTEPGEDNTELTKEWERSAKDYCQNIKIYSDDEERLNNEVLKFRDWSENKNKRISEYKWKVYTALHFDKGEEAKEMCSTLPIDIEEKSCELTIEWSERLIGSYDEFHADCWPRLDFLGNLICQAENK